MRRLACHVLASLFMAVASVRCAAAQGAEGASPARNHFTVGPATSEIRVDGALDEPAWSDAARVPLTHEWFPSDNTVPPVATECLVTFDSESLYVGFRAADPDPSAIRAYLADRDTAFLDDSVGFLIDTFHDRRRAFQFRVNPLGVQMESIVSDLDGTEDWSWDAIWDSAGRVTAQGYEVEIAVPLKQLRFPRASEVQTWGFLAIREYPRSVLHKLRSTVNDRSQNCLVCQFDTLAGFQRIETGHNLEVVPTVIAKRADARATLTAPLESGDEEAEAGLSLRWGITPNVTLSAALNPDFSQVEADAAQLDVNERFALLFPEKRPFFLEGIEFFNTRFNAVFTRTVADPELGFKLTGKEGSHAFGILLTEDRINNLLFPGAQGSSLDSVDGEHVTTGMLRYRRDIGKTSTLGVLYTGRKGDTDYGNHLYGLDGTLRLSDSDTFRFQVLNTNTRYAPQVAVDNGQPLGSFDGAGWNVDYRHATRNWAWRAGYFALEPGFRADSGFIPQVDVRQSLGQVIRTVWGKPGAWFSRWQFQASAQLFDTYDGEPIEHSGNLTATYEGPLQSQVLLGLRPNRETFRGRTFDNFRRDLLVTLRPSGRLGLELFLRGGEIIDFATARQADFELVRPKARFQLGRRLSGELEHTWQVFEFHGDRFLEANLTQTRLIYHLNIRTFLRAILQYRDVERISTAGTTEQEILFSQLLFSYKLNPQTVLLLGYSDDHEGTETLEIRQRDRAVFLKIGYAWLW